MSPAAVHDNVSFGRRIEVTLSNSLSFRRRGHTPSISHCAREENPAMSKEALRRLGPTSGKSEIRISKSETNSNDENPKPATCVARFGFGDSNFGFVSDFEIRISDLRPRGSDSRAAGS